MNKNEIPEDPDNDPSPLKLGEKFGLYAVAVMGGILSGYGVTNEILNRPDFLNEGYVVGVAVWVLVANKLSKYLFPKSND